MSDSRKLRFTHVAYILSVLAFAAAGILSILYVLGMVSEEFMVLSVFLFIASMILFLSGIYSLYQIEKKKDKK